MNNNNIVSYLDNNRIALVLKTEDDANRLINEVGNNDVSEAILSYGSETCISFRNGNLYYASFDYYRDDGYTVITWDDYDSIVRKHTKIRKHTKRASTKDNEKENLLSQLEQAKDDLAVAQENVNNLRDKLDKLIKAEKLDKFWEKQWESYEDHDDFYVLTSYGIEGKVTGSSSIEQFKSGELLLSEKHATKRALHDKILTGMYLFAKSHNDLADIGSSSNSTIYCINYSYKDETLNTKIMIYPTEWVAFNTENVAKGALELFKDELLEYYKLAW